MYTYSVCRILFNLKKIILIYILCVNLHEHDMILYPF